MHGAFYFGNIWFGKTVRPSFFRFAQYISFEKSHILDQLSQPKSVETATPIIVFEINGKMDLEKFVCLPLISAQILETFDLL